MVRADTCKCLSSSDGGSRSSTPSISCNVNRVASLFKPFAGGVNVAFILIHHTQLLHRVEPPPEARLSLELEPKNQKIRLRKATLLQPAPPPACSCELPLAPAGPPVGPTRRLGRRRMVVGPRSFVGDARLPAA